MRILSGYLFRSIVGTTAMVLLVLLALGGFIEFMSQLDELGEGNYSLGRALFYVLLKLPRMAADMLPVSVLLGALLGLGALASHSELIVMRAAGVSLAQLGRLVAVTGVVIAIFGAVLGEYIGPPLDRYARQYKAVSKNNDVRLTGGAAIWLRDGNSIYNINRSEDGFGYGGVYVYTMNPYGGLQGIGVADNTQVGDDNQWVLNNFRQTLISGNGVSVSEEEQSRTVNNLNADLLELAVIRTSSLDGAELYRYVQYLRSNGLDSQRYEIAFWSRIASTAGIAVMCVLALPFVFGTLRASGAGTRMLIGILIGLGYFLLSRTMADSGEVYDLHPVLVAWAPTLLLSGVTVLAISRVR